MGEVMSNDIIQSINRLVASDEIEEAAQAAARLRPRLVAEHIDYHAMWEEGQPWLEFGRSWIEAADPLEFGAYHASQAAQKRHEQSLRAAVDNAEALRARMEELAGGTLALARRYSDLEELNRAIGGDVADALRRKA